MLKNILYILTILSILQIELFAQGGRYFNPPSGIQPSDYTSGKIVIKVADIGIPGQSARNQSINSFNPNSPPPTSKILKLEPLNSSISRSSRGRVRPSYYLRNMYEITLQSGADLAQEINKLLKYKNVIYAEPVYLEQLLFIPNDPSANPTSGSQAHLEVINAYNAWDIEQGDPSISVAIIDTGTDLDHPDLVDNLLLNSADPVNGVDDDGDGLIDNFNGYDFADEDNDPGVTNGHGVLVSGLSSAATNNGMGIAGTGFNSSFVPYKIFPDGSNSSSNAYAAVLYAAQHHQVLNLSWGSPNSFSQANQDISGHSHSRIAVHSFKWFKYRF